MTKIYTVQISVAHRLSITKDPRYLDTTVKSGDKTFAPTWEMVMGHKKEQISAAVYRGSLSISITRQAVELPRSP